MFLHLENVVQSMKKASPSKSKYARMGLVPPLRQRCRHAQFMTNSDTTLAYMRPRPSISIVMPAI